MPANLYPLMYRPGIQRDGTVLASDACTDGQWVRFQRGKIKKIGGMKSSNTFGNSNKTTSGALLTPFGANIIFGYIPTINLGNIEIKSFYMGHNFNGTNIRNTYLTIPNNPLLLWQSAIITTATKSYIVFLGANNLADITQNSASLFYYGELFDNAPFDNVNIDPLINGGMCFSAPYLFLYGSNGTVIYSKPNDPFDFSGGRLNISNDKVIFGSSVRGGSNAPSVLFWSFSSVVRISNVGEQNVEFKIDVIAKNTTILSSRCVVEYDGLFFWPGIDRFFVFNGIVQEMVNTTNLNYFFDNLDLNQRQLVFGLKNPKYGEIWWFYPVKGTQGNSRVLIYNKRENSWYDTAISRSCGGYIDELGILYSFGAPLVAADDNLGRFWRHEYGTDEICTINNLDVRNKIPGHFTTPVFSWMAPTFTKLAGQSALIDRWTQLSRVEPDFIYSDPNNSEMQVVVNARTYAQSPKVESAPFIFNRLTEKIDILKQGRQMSLTFSSDNDFEAGQIMLQLDVGDGQ
jgi:hypothetical protein